MNMITFPKLTFLLFFTLLTSDLFGAADSPWSGHNSPEWQPHSLFHSFNNDSPPNNQYLSFDQQESSHYLDSQPNLNLLETYAESFEYYQLTTQQQDNFFQYSQPLISPAMLPNDLMLDKRSGTSEEFSSSMLPTESSVSSPDQEHVFNTDESASVSDFPLPRKNRKRYGRSDEAYACHHEGCTYVATRQDYLTKHICRHTGEKPFKCTYEGCHYTAIQKSSLNKHMISHAAVNPLKCTYKDCTYTTSIQGNLTKHMRIHIVDKSFKCPHDGCEYATARKSSIETHMSTHAKEKPFKCTYGDCNYSAARQDYLTQHIRKHTGEKPFKCSYEGCNYAAKQKTPLTLHLLTHINEDQKTKRQRSLNCSKTNFNTGDTESSDTTALVQSKGAH